MRDPRFEAHGAAIKWSVDHAARWYDERQLRQVLKEEDWSDVFLIAHHAQFDGFILSHHYDIVPQMYGCTLSMARLVLGTHTSVSLDSVRAAYGLAAKRTPYNLFRDKHWRELDAQTQEQVAAGACDEAESIWTIFGKLAETFPEEEYAVVDATIRCFTQPVLRGDNLLLSELWESEASQKRDRNKALNVTSEDLQSADKFASLLSEAGVDVEYKDGKKGLIPCFAKTDDFMRELLEHEDEHVRGLAEARLGVKSTLLQSRAETLGWMAGRGPCPVYLKFWGAHTGRWSGGDKCNWQNFTRGSPLRKAIMAPEGCLLGVIDLAQIERRITAYLSGEWDYLEEFRQGHDPYLATATRFYKRPITKADKIERQVAKVIELQCQYGSGGAKIVQTLKNAGIKLTEEQGVAARDAFRAAHPGTVQLWNTAGRMIARLAGGKPLEWGPCLIKDGKLYGPNGTWLDYSTLQYYTDPDTNERYWRVEKRSSWSKLYGGKLVENLVQYLARLVLSQAMLRIIAAGYRVVTTSHDEIVVVLPDDSSAAERLEWCRQEMAVTPDWMPGIPLDAEASMGQRYSK